MNELIERCIDKAGCQTMEIEIKRLGLWRAYREALTGSNDDVGVSEADQVLWGWSWEQRRIAARQVCT